jgi:4-hydroxy-tetrahydrodipicolinate reductase
MSQPVLHLLCRGGACFADNAQFYADNGVPFVMGTTGGDPQKVAAAAEAAGVYAVVSPQMGKQVGAAAAA